MTSLPDNRGSIGVSRDPPTPTSVTDDGGVGCLATAEAWDVPFETALSAGRRSRRRQRHLSGLVSATTGCHLGVECWLERDHVILLDFAPAAVGIASQPSGRSWRDESAAEVECGSNQTSTFQLDGTIRSTDDVSMPSRLDGSLRQPPTESTHLALSRNRTVDVSSAFLVESHRSPATRPSG